MASNGGDTGMDKKKLTKKQLFKDYHRMLRYSVRKLFLFIPFGLLCIILIPLPPLGWGLGLLTFLIFYILYRKVRAEYNTGNPMRSYIKLLTLSTKKESVTGDEGDYSFYYYLTFEENITFEVTRKRFREAEEGKPCYVAFFEKDDKPFMSYSLDRWDPDGSLPVR